MLMAAAYQYYSLQKVHADVAAAKSPLEDESGLIAAHRVKFHELVTAALLEHQ
jgi:hypothetical protein